MELVGAVLSLLVLLVSLNALLKCAAELKLIRLHLDKLTPEALTALKTARRTAAYSPASRSIPAATSPATPQEASQSSGSGETG